MMVGRINGFSAPEWGFHRRSQPLIHLHQGSLLIGVHNREVVPRSITAPAPSPQILDCQIVSFLQILKLSSTWGPHGGAFSRILGMLISFEVKNYRSLRSSAHLSMLAQNSDVVMSSSLIKRNISSKNVEITLVPSLAIYGANGAGKTNIINAIDYVTDAVARSHAFWEPDSGTRITQFAFGSGEENLSVFDVEFISNSIKYNYGFSCTPEMFCEEWLYSYPNNREKLIFERNTDKLGNGKYKTIINYNQKAKEARNIKDCEKRVRENSLVVAAGAQDGQEAAKIVTDFFRNGIVVLQTTHPMEDLDVGFTSQLIDTAGYSDDVLRFIKVADPRVKEILVKERNQLEFFSRLEETLGQVPDYIKQINKYEVSFLYRKEDGTETSLDFYDQSRGTKRLYGLSGWIASSLLHGRALVIDELESSMHTHLCQFIIELFQNPETNPRGAQIIFTTHDTNILDADILRRDQIWFAEKGNIGDTYLYPLTDYSPRKDENLQKGYLRGRYGAIPALGLSEAWLKKEKTQPDSEGH